MLVATNGSAVVGTMSFAAQYRALAQRDAVDNITLMNADQIAAWVDSLPSFEDQGVGELLKSKGMCSAGALKNVTAEILETKVGLKGTKYGLALALPELVNASLQAAYHGEVVPAFPGSVSLGGDSAHSQGGVSAGKIDFSDMPQMPVPAQGRGGVFAEWQGAGGMHNFASSVKGCLTANMWMPAAAAVAKIMKQKPGEVLDVDTLITDMGGADSNAVLYGALWSVSLSDVPTDEKSAAARHMARVHEIQRQSVPQEIQETDDGLRLLAYFVQGSITRVSSIEAAKGKLKSPDTMHSIAAVLDWIPGYIQLGDRIEKAQPGVKEYDRKDIIAGLRAALSGIRIKCGEHGMMGSPDSNIHSNR